MDERYQMVDSDWAREGGLVSVCAINLGFKRSGTGSMNYLYLTEISRDMGSIVPVGWKWSRGAMPEDIYKELLDYFRAMLDEFVQSRYGVQPAIPD